MRLRNCSMNVRLIANKNGDLAIGFVHKPYAIKQHMEWKDLPESLRAKLAKQLGVKLLPQSR